jgi:hypothetical protein
MFDNEMITGKIIVRQWGGIWLDNEMGWDQGLS